MGGSSYRGFSLLTVNYSNCIKEGSKKSTVIDVGSSKRGFELSGVGCNCSMFSCSVKRKKKNGTIMYTQHGFTRDEHN